LSILLISFRKNHVCVVRFTSTTTMLFLDYISKLSFYIIHPICFYLCLFFSYYYRRFINL